MAENDKIPVRCDREKKLLYLTVIVAVLFEALTLYGLYHPIYFPPRAEMVADDLSCHAHLNRCYVAYIQKSSLTCRKGI